MLQRFLLIGTLLGLLALPTNVGASEFLELHLEISGIASGNIYSAWVRPGFGPTVPGSNIEFQSAVIASADQQWKVSDTAATSGWHFDATPQFTSYASLLSALQQPWTISLDQGLPSARQYTMSLNLGSLATTNLTPPVIEFPLPNSAIDPLTSTFKFSPPGLNFPFNVALEHLPNHALLGSYVFDVNYVPLPAGSTQWSVPVPLIDNTQYFLNLILNGNPAEVAFTDPIDAQGNAIPGWSSGADFTLESSSPFSTPEPGRSAVIAIFATLLLIRPRQRC